MLVIIWQFENVLLIKECDIEFISIAFIVFPSWSTQLFSKNIMFLVDGRDIHSVAIMITSRADIVFNPQKTSFWVFWLLKRLVYISPIFPRCSYLLYVSMDIFDTTQEVWNGMPPCLYALFSINSACKWTDHFGITFH